MSCAHGARHIAGTPSTNIHAVIISAVELFCGRVPSSLSLLSSVALMQVPTNTDSLLKATSSLAFCPPGYVRGILAQQARRAGPSAHLIPHSAPCATAAAGLLEPSALPLARRFAFLKDLARNACANIYIPA